LRATGDLREGRGPERDAGAACANSKGWRRANPDVPVAGVLQKPFAFEELLRLIA